MIEEYKPKHFFDVLSFILDNVNNDFFITENNERVVIRDSKTLKRLIKQSSRMYVDIDSGDVRGIIALWRGLGSKRFFVKLNCADTKSANRLVTMVVWNDNKDLYIKIKKDSDCVKVFREKKFDFFGNRGNEILLRNDNTGRSINEYSDKDTQFKTGQFS